MDEQIALYLSDPSQIDFDPTAQTKIMLAILVELRRLNEAMRRESKG